MTILRKIFFFILIISPALSITGANDFSTGLNLAALLHLPSINPLNYVFLVLFFFTFVGLNAHKSIANILISTCFLLFSLVLLRHPTPLALLGLVSIFASFLLFMDDKVGLTVISAKDERRLFKIYAVYILVSIAVHVYILLTQSSYYANDRMMGIFKNPNQLGFFIVAFYLLYIIKIKKHKTKFRDYVIPIILFIPVILTGSRSALACLLIIHLCYFFILKKWNYFLFLMLGLAVTIALASPLIDGREVLETISRRKIDSLNGTGNMRLEILQDFFNEGSFADIAIGKSVSIGTNGMIFEQRMHGEKIIWLDSLINVIAYNWGILGLIFFCLVTLIYALQNFPILKKNFLLLIFFIVASYFFVLADFFPLVFLIVFFKNDTSKIFSNNSVL